MLQSPISIKSLACALMLIALASLSNPMTSRAMLPGAKETIAQSIADLSLPPLGTPQGRPRGGGSRNCDDRHLNFV